MEGKLIFETSSNSNITEITFEQPTGLYLLSIQTDTNRYHQKFYLVNN